MNSGSTIIHSLPASGALQTRGFRPVAPASGHCALGSVAVGLLRKGPGLVSSTPSKGKWVLGGHTVLSSRTLLGAAEEELPPLSFI